MHVQDQLSFLCAATTDTNLALIAPTRVSTGDESGEMAVDGAFNSGVDDVFSGVTWWQVDLGSDHSQINQMAITVLSTFLRLEW